MARRKTREDKPNSPPLGGSSFKKKDQPDRGTTLDEALATISSDDAKFEAQYGNFGAPRKVESAAELWDHFRLYVALRSAIRMNLMPLPLTVVSWCNYLGIARSTWYAWRDENAATYRPDLSDIITRVEECIKDQMITGAITGAYKENIVARITGLADKQDHNVKVSKTLKDFYDDAGVGAVDETDT